MGAQLAKVDVKAAYRLVPVHPVDGLFLGLQSLFVDCMLPFGLRSVPKIFTAVAGDRKAGGGHIFSFCLRTSIVAGMWRNWRGWALGIHLAQLLCLQ